VEGHVDSIVYRPVGNLLAVGKLQGVQEWVSLRDFEVGQHKAPKLLHNHGDQSLSDPWLFGDGDDGGDILWKSFFSASVLHLGICECLPTQKR